MPYWPSNISEPTLTVANTVVQLVTYPRTFLYIEFFDVGTHAGKWINRLDSHNICIREQRHHHFQETYVVAIFTKVSLALLDR